MDMLVFREGMFFFYLASEIDKQAEVPVASSMRLLNDVKFGFLILLSDLRKVLFVCTCFILLPQLFVPRANNHHQLILQEGLNSKKKIQANGRCFNQVLPSDLFGCFK